MALFTGGKKVEKLTQDNERLTKEVAKLKQLHDKLNRENGDLRMEKSNLLIDIETLRSQLNTFMEKYVDVEELEKKAAELKDRVNELESAPPSQLHTGISYDEIPVHLHAEIEQLEERKSALEKEIATKEAYLEKLNAQFDLLEQAALKQMPQPPQPVGDIAEMTAEQEGLQEIILELRHQKSELENEIAALRSERAEPSEMPHFDPFASFGSTATAAAESEEIQRLRAQLSEKEAELLSLGQRLNEELADKNLEISSLRTQLDDKSRQMSALGMEGITISAQPETEQLPSWLTGDETASPAATPEPEVPVSDHTPYDSREVEDMLTEKDMQIENLQETIANLNIEIQSLQEQIAEAQATAATSGAFNTIPEDNLDDLPQQIPGAGEINPDELPASLMQQFESEIENLRQLSVEHEALKAEKEGLLNRLSESESSLIDLNRQLDTVLLENERLNNEVDALLEELEAVKSNPASPVAPGDEMPAKQSFDEKEEALATYLEKRDGLNTEVISLRKEVERLTALAKEQSDGLMRANEEFAVLDAKRSEVLLNIQQLEEKRALLTKELTGLEESRNSLKSSVDGLTGTVNDLEATSKVLEEKQIRTEELVLEALKSFNQEVASLREQQSKIRASIVEKEKAKSLKESEIEKLDLELGELRSEIKIAEKDLANIRQHIQSLRDEKESLNRNLFEMKDTEKRVNLIVQELKKNRDSLKEENDELERKLTSMFNNFTKRHNELEARRVELESTIKARQIELTTTQENIENSGLMLDRVKAELHSLELQKNELVNSIERLKKIEHDANDSTSGV